MSTADIATLSFTLNGQATTVEARAKDSLLDLLREKCGITSPKDGCAPQATCGCCAVYVDGKVKLSCVVPAPKCQGKDVVTLEGLPDEDRYALAESFARSGGLQCGFCIPGIALKATDIVARNPDPSREDVARGLDQHLCRCTGYAKIIDAVQMYARVKRGEAWPEASACGGVGTPLPKYEAHELALGLRPYINDMERPGMLHGALVFSEHPRARVLSIDTGEALEVPGVVQVITAGDVPGERYQGLITRDWPQMVAVGEDTRYQGDVLACVAAETRRAARKAASLVKVEYEVLEPVTDPREALKPEAPRLHPDGNLLSVSRTNKGDVEEGRRASAHVVTGTWTTQWIEHAFLEPEAALAVPGQDEDGPLMEVYSPGQGVFDDRRQVASLLGLPLERVRVELVTNGGAFGGKEDLGVQGHAALLAWATERPVKLALSRDESIRFHPKRHPIAMDYEVGCDEQGRLTFVRARMVGDKGAYASVGAKVLERAAGHATGAYRVPNVDVKALAVYTNNPPCGAMRGFGANQAAFAMDGALDMLAEKCGLDGWEIRWRNVLVDGDRFGTGQLLKNVGLRATLEAVKDAYYQSRHAGIACGIKNVGIGNGMPDDGEAVIEVHDNGTATIYTGFTEMGQGLFTVLIQTAVEETGLPAEVFRVKASTDKATPCGMTTASRGTVLGCAATRAAALKLKADLDAGQSLQQLAGREYYGEYHCRFTTKLGADVAEPITHITYGYATQVVTLDDDGRLEQVVAAHDVGKVMNPILLQGQIEGSIHMGLGFALTENLAVEAGRFTSTRLKDVGVLRAKDMPPVDVRFVEIPEPNGPYGARGVGEIGLVPTAGAVHGALYAYDKKRRFSLPMKDSPAAKHIKPR